MAKYIACHDCGLIYGGIGWCDVVIPNSVWVRISPAGDAGGILCFTCMAARLMKLGIVNVPMMICSGPFSHDPSWAFDKGFQQAATLMKLGELRS